MNKNTPFTVALTGGMGSGKSLVGGMFCELGVCVADSDHIVHTLLAPDTPFFDAIKEHFGDAVINPDNTLSRKKLADIIFASVEEKTWLEQLLHPEVYKQLKDIAKDSTAPYCMMLIPLLFESGHDQDFDRILVVDAPETLQIARARQRDNADEKTIRTILSHQLPREARLAQADDVISNEDDLASLREQVVALHEKYLVMASR